MFLWLCAVALPYTPIPSLQAKAKRQRTKELTASRSAPEIEIISLIGTHRWLGLV
jgi:hypothetical protein